MGIPFGYKSRAPIYNILLLSSILSLFSAYLGKSGYMIDTVRYAWSFLYRYPMYYDSVNTMISARTEVGFLLINMLIGRITHESFWLFLFIAFVTTFINLYTASKISRKYTLIVFLYLISLYFFQTTYILRQNLAVSFANLAFLSYTNDLRIRYIMFSLVAITFHATALILLPLYFVLKGIKSKKNYYYILMIFSVSFFLFEPIFNLYLPKIPYFGQLFNTEEANLTFGGGSSSVIFKGVPFYIITVIALVRRNRLKQIMYKADAFIACSFFYSMSWLLSYNMYWFFRIGWYFLLPTLALVPSLFSTFKNPRERVIYYTIFIFVLIFITYRQIVIVFN
ncbi:EpsG family protein [Mesobacillus thioparans]|uniref:EpsG family protein n=1 Tax=Mesobacillus thioparans TaxID=370439 RepID=UPI0039EDF299